MLPVGTNLEVSKPPKATLTLIAINIAIFVLQSVASDTSLKWTLDNLAFRPENLNPIGVVTSLFLHGDFFHLFGNMLYLWLFGGPVEERIGSKLFTYYYFGAGLWSTALWGLLESIARPENPGGAIGASGAISGIMALFLYRCYYGRIKMSLPILPTFIFAPWARFSLPAAPLLVYWFLRDFIGGIESMRQSAGIAYWGHVGGFLFGLAVGRIKRYGHEGQLEQAKKKLFDKIRNGCGWKENNAEAELLKLLKLAPRDPEVHHQLAHFYVANEQPKKAEEHYQHAVNRYFLSDPVAGAYAVIDHADALKKPMASNHHLKAADIFMDKRYPDDAYKALKPVVDKGENGVIAERAGALFIKVCQSLNKTEEAQEAVQQFTSRFPASKYAREVQQALALKPDAVFPPKKEPPPKPARPVSRGDEEENSLFFEIMHQANKLITDPLFLFLWIFILSWGGARSLYGITFTFFFSLLITFFYRLDWVRYINLSGRKSDEEAKNEFDSTVTFDRAVLAEKGENYQKAASLYEKLLNMTPGNMQARFNLSRIYLNRLEDKENGIRQLKKLREGTPPDHPYHVFAEDELKNIASRFSVPKNP